MIYLSTSKISSLLRRGANLNYCRAQTQPLKNGYTLIEIMVALSIFAILALITSTVMSHIFDTRTRVSAQSEQLSNLQFMMSIVERDTAQATNRAVRGDHMQLFSSWIGYSDYVEFTRGGLPNPNHTERRSTIKRIAYLCKNNKLIRRSWAALDTPKRIEANDRIILDHLSKCSFAYIAHNRQVLHEWREHAVQQNQKPAPLPIAIQLTLELSKQKDMSLLFIIPEGLYDS